MIVDAKVVTIITEIRVFLPRLDAGTYEYHMPVLARNEGHQRWMVECSVYEHVFSFMFYSSPMSLEELILFANKAVELYKYKTEKYRIPTKP